MSPLLIALLLGAEPNVKAATACMEEATNQHAACMAVVRGEVPPERRTAAARTCGGAHQRALEHCLVTNGVPISARRRELWQARAAVSEALSACFGGVENDFKWCAARVAVDGDLTRCREGAERGFAACKAERDVKEAALAAEEARLTAPTSPQ